MAARNPTRVHLVEKLEKLVDDYNLGTLGLEAFFEALKVLVAQMEEQESRAAREGLSEEELDRRFRRCNSMASASERRSKLDAPSAWPRLGVEPSVCQSAPNVCTPIHTHPGYDRAIARTLSA